jgi:hypothetical protein
MSARAVPSLALNLMCSVKVRGSCAVHERQTRNGDDSPCHPFATLFQLDLADSIQNVVKLLPSRN